MCSKIYKYQMGGKGQYFKLEGEYGPDQGNFLVALGACILPIHENAKLFKYLMAI